MSSVRQRRGDTSRLVAPGCNAWTDCWECKGTRLRPDQQDACRSCAQRAEFTYVAQRDQEANADGNG